MTNACILDLLRESNAARSASSDACAQHFLKMNGARCGVDSGVIFSEIEA